MQSVVAKSLRIAAVVSRIRIPFLTPSNSWLTTRLFEVMLSSTRKLSNNLQAAVSSTLPPISSLRRTLYNVDMDGRCPPALRPINMPLRHGVRLRDDWTEYLCQQLTTVVSLVEEGAEACYEAVEELTSAIDDALEDLTRVEKRVKQRADPSGLLPYSTRNLYEAIASHLETIKRAAERLPSTDMYTFTLVHPE